MDFTNLNSVVSFDLDSTLCDTQHRRGIINTDNRELTDWTAYSMACAGDGEGPAFGMAAYLASIGQKFVITSRRDVAALDLTGQWLKDRGLLAATIEINLLKGKYSNAKTNQGAWKVQSVKDFEARTGCNVRLHVDDWADVTRQMLEAGIPAMTVIDWRGFEGEYLYGNSSMKKMESLPVPKSNAEVTQ